VAQEFTLLIVELVKNILSGFARSIKKVTVDINRIVPRGSLYDRVDLIAHRTRWVNCTVGWIVFIFIGVTEVVQGVTHISPLIVIMRVVVVRFTLYYVHLALGFINLLEYLGDSF
tara:strand:+ start:89 stop:433 length:345 start_codon:yes stop_codon:yes gene_type:complete